MLANCKIITAVAACICLTHQPAFAQQPSAPISPGVVHFNGDSKNHLLGFDIRLARGWHVDNGQTGSLFGGELIDGPFGSELEVACINDTAHQFTGDPFYDRADVGKTPVTQPENFEPLSFNGWNGAIHVSALPGSGNGIMKNGLCDVEAYLKRDDEVIIFSLGPTSRDVPLSYYLSLKSMLYSIVVGPAPG